MSLGAHRGRGDWGVSTLKVNPITGMPTITLFATAGDAIEYARERALRSGPPERPVGATPDRSVKGRVYYVMHGDNILYRALRGMRGEMKTHRDSIPQRNVEYVMVFEHKGELPNGKPRWDMIPGLSKPVPDLEAEYERMRDARGTEKLSREDAGTLKRGNKQKVRQGRGPTFGPASSEPSNATDLRRRQLQREQVTLLNEQRSAREVETLHERDRQAAIRSATHLRERIGSLYAVKDRLDQLYVKKREPQTLQRITLVEEALDEARRQLAVFNETIDE